MVAKIYYFIIEKGKRRTRKEESASQINLKLNDTKRNCKWDRSTPTHNIISKNYPCTKYKTKAYFFCPRQKQLQPGTDDSRLSFLRRIPLNQCRQHLGWESCPTNPAKWKKNKGYSTKNRTIVSLKNARMTLED